MIEFTDEVVGVFVQHLVRHPGFRDVEVENCGHDVESSHEQQGHFTDTIDSGFEEREIKVQQFVGDIRLDQGAADDHAKDDGSDRQPLDPAVGDDQQAVRQVFGEDAVLGRRVGRRTETDDRVGQEWMHVPEHHRAADDLDRIADEHHPPFGHGIGKSAD